MPLSPLGFCGLKCENGAGLRLDSRPEIVFGSGPDVAEAWRVEAELEQSRYSSESNVRSRIHCAVTSLVEFLDVARRNLGTTPQNHRYMIQRLDTGNHLVCFDGERGEVRGVGFLRFVLLCRHRRAGVEFLGSDASALAASRSIAVTADGERPQREAQRAIATVMVSSEFRRLRDVIANRIDDINLRLESAQTEEEREGLEHDLRHFESYRNGYWRFSDSEVRKNRDKIERAWTRKADELAHEMPSFSDHLRTTWRYDSRIDEYVYEGVDWHFDGF